jgi:creatinine amidohydrolase
MAMPDAADEVRWERMFPDQLEAAFQRRPLLYVPYGLCEPHGPQCTLGLDALKAHALCVRAARVGGGIVAPPDYWHIHEVSGYATWAERHVGEVPRTWLTSLPPWQHFKNVLYHLRAADAIGFEAIVLLTGHYGPNWEDLKTLVRLVQPHVGATLDSLPDFEINTPGFDGDGAGGDHAGKVETSLLWALEPECVDVSRLPDSDGPHFAMGQSAPQSERRVGERMADDIARNLAKRGEAALAQYASAPRRPRLATFEQVERVWHDVVAPALPQFRTMQPSWDGTEPSPTSRWRANWPVPEHLS